MSWYNWRIGPLAYAPLQSVGWFRKAIMHIGRETWVSFGPFFWRTENG